MLLNFLYFSYYWFLFYHRLRNLRSWLLYFLFLLRRFFNLNRSRGLHAWRSKLWHVWSRSGLDIPNRRSELRSTSASAHSSSHRYGWPIHRRSEGNLLSRSLRHRLGRLFLLLFLFLASFEVKFMRGALTSAAISALLNNRQ